VVTRRYSSGRLPQEIVAASTNANRNRRVANLALDPRLEDVARLLRGEQIGVGIVDHRREDVGSAMHAKALDVLVPGAEKVASHLQAVVAARFSPQRIEIDDGV